MEDSDGGQVWQTVMQDSDGGQSCKTLLVVGALVKCARPAMGNSAGTQSLMAVT